MKSMIIKVIAGIVVSVACGAVILLSLGTFSGKTDSVDKKDDTSISSSDNQENNGEDADTNDKDKNNGDDSEKSDTETDAKSTCNIIVSTEWMIEEPGGISHKPIKKGVFTSYDKWIKAVEKSNNEDIKEISGQYDEEFFENNNLYYFPTTKSGGYDFEFDSVDIKEESGKKIMYINVTYSTEHVLNTLHGYAFLVSMSKEDAVEVDDIDLNWLYDRAERK